MNYSNWTPRQVLAGLFLICGLGLGYTVASSLWKARAQGGAVTPPANSNLPQNAAPPPAEDLPPENFPGGQPGAPTNPQFDANGLPLDESSPSIPQEPALRVVNPEGFIYNPEGLRDPFFPTRRGGPIVVDSATGDVKQSAEIEYDPREPLQSDKLADYRLVGVMWDVKDPRALIQTPQGKVLTVKKKFRLGREGAVIVAIRESEIVVAEPNPDGTYANASTRVITMKK